MNGPALLQLQLVDTELDHLAALERRLPERAAVDAAQAAHRAWHTRRAQAVSEAEAAMRIIEQTEHDAHAIDTKRSRLEAQLKTVIAPREAEALMHEIALLKQQRDALDDVELEAMDAQGTAEGTQAALDAEEPSLLETIASAEAALAAAAADLAGQRAALHDRRAAADADLDDADRTAYDALRSRFEGVGVVQLDGRRCTGCHLDLSAGEADVVKSAAADTMPECPHCGRLIVR